MKKLLSSFLICILCVSVFAAEFTNAEKAKFQQIHELRPELGCMPTYQDAVDTLNSELDLLKSERSLYSEEFYLTLENILTWEKYNYLLEIEFKDPQLEPLITAQYKKIREYINSHKNEKFNSWFYETAADVLAASLQFLPINKAMSEGLNVKKYYDEALEINPDFTFALMNIAQWYYYAPAISGGGKNKTLKSLVQSVEKAKDNIDKFYSYAMLSQIYFDMGNKDEAKNCLEKATALYPDSKHTQKLKIINENNYSYFSYVTDREKLDKKIFK